MEKKQQDGTRHWLCTVCKYIHEGDAPPDICPVCGAPWSKFIPHTEEEGSTDKIDRWRCVVCNHISLGKKAPQTCPICGSGREKSRLETKSPVHNHRGFSGLVERLHLHPVTAHLPNGALPLALIAWVVYLLSGEFTLERASFYLMLVAVASMPVTFFSGLSDAKHRFKTTTTGIFPKKKFWSWVLITIGFGLVFWRLLAGWNNVPQSTIEVALYTGLLLAETAIAARLGNLGGKLVFGH